jgi:hypothetical protein
MLMRSSKKIGATSWATGRPKNLTVTYSSGTVAITAGQACPPGSVLTSANVCTMLTDFTGGTVNARPNVTCDPINGANGTNKT